MMSVSLNFPPKHEDREYLNYILVFTKVLYTTNECTYQQNKQYRTPHPPSTGEHIPFYFNRFPKKINGFHPYNN